MTERWGLVLAAGVSTVVCLASGTGVAAPGDDLPLSNDAALMGGAVLASGTSVGTLWYNPAVLGEIRDTETEANAEAIGVRLFDVDRGAELALPDGRLSTTDLEDAQVISVPSTFAGAFTVSEKLTVGFGLFTPRSSEFSAAATTQSSDASGPASLFQVRARRSVARLWANLGVGYQPTPNLQLGASVVAGMETVEDEQSVYLSRSLAGVGSASFWDERLSSTAFGMGAAVGLRGRLGKYVRGAATVRTPTFLLTETTELSGTGSQVSAGGSSNEVVSGTEAVGRNQLDGWRVGTGVSVGNERVLGAIDLEGSMGSRTRSRTGGASVATRLGAKVDVGKRFALGGGVFYRSPDTSDASIGAARFHLFGGSLGLEVRRRLELRNRGGIEFRTVVAAWYAHGRGTTNALWVEGLDADPFIEVSTYDAPTTTHLVALHLGSSLSF